MSGVNKWIGIGNLCRDPEIRYTKSGEAVASFSIACNETWKKDGEKQERVEFVRLIVWRKLAEVCGEYLSKGSKIYVEGKLQTQDWEDKDGNKKQMTKVIVNQMVMLSAPTNNKPTASSEPTNDFDDGDIPF